MSALSGYGELTRLVGRWYLILIIAARLPLAMTTFGTITFVSLERGSVADAGLVAGVLALCTAIAQPLHGRWTQSAGQRVPLVLLAPTCAAALGGLVWAGVVEAPLWVFMLLAAGVGATQVPVGGLSRVRWGDVVRDSRQMRTSISLESVIEEATFVMGPALVGILAATLDHSLPLIVAMAGMLVIVPIFALHPLSPGPAGHDQTGTRMSIGRTLAYVWAPVLGMAMIGMFFGSVQTTVSAVSQYLGSPGAGGLIYALMGIGSATTALTAVMLPDRWRLSVRVVVAAAVMGVAAFAAVWTDRGAPTPMFVLLCLLMVLGGCGVGIALVSLYAIIADQAPATGSAVALTAASAAIVAGVAIGAAIGGRVSESTAVGYGFFPSVVACVVLAGLTLHTARRAGGQDPAPGR